jgi:hypothetical protein
LGNPVKYVDPTGHGICGDFGDQATCPTGRGSFFVRSRGGFSDEQQRAIEEAYSDVGLALAILTPENDTPWEAFRKHYKTSADDPLLVELDPDCYYCRSREAVSACGGQTSGSVGGISCVPQFGFTESPHHILFASMSETTDPMYRALKQRNNVVHELAHAFDQIRGLVGRNGLPADIATNRYGLAPGGAWQQSTEDTPGEVFADSFLGLIYDTWETDPVGLTDAAVYRRDSMIVLAYSMLLGGR